MKKHYKHLAVLGTLCCIAALAVLWMAVLTVDWISIQEPQVDQLELDKLGPYEEPKPHLIRAKFGLFKMCVQSSVKSNIECHELDWYNFGIINFNSAKKPPVMPTELIANCVEKLRFTLPFIGLSVVFTSASFLCLTFGHFCPRNKKIIEASMLILGGLCQATALLTFVSQIGSEFEANLPYSFHQKKLTTFYRYKYGYSFYLFLLSFSLSELAALFDMAAYFRKFPPNHYVITFHRQEPSPFMPIATTHGTLPQNHTNPNTLSRTGHPNHMHHNYNGQGTLTKQCPGPDVCNDFSSEHIDLTVTRIDEGMSMSMSGGVSGNGGFGMPLPPQSYINPEVTITTIERNTGYGTIRNHPKITNTATMESFGTLRKENNV